MLCRPRPGTGCDVRHTNSLFVLRRARRGPPYLVPSSRNRMRSIAWRKARARSACGPS
jgi:hypothetical protein